MSRTAFTYSRALATLDQHEHSLVEKLDTVAGAGLLAAVPMFPPALALLEAKNEAVSLLKRLADKASARITSTAGRDRQDLIMAANTILGIAAVLDALQEVLGKHYKALALADGEILTASRRKMPQAASQAKPSSQHLIDQLLDLGFPLPSQDYGFEENVYDRLKPRLKEFATDLVHFCEGLQAWADLNLNSSSTTRRIVDIAIRKYKSSFWAFAAHVPDLQIWMAATEHGATRTRLDKSIGHVREILEMQSASLGKVYDLLSLVSPADRPSRTSNRGLLARAASAVLAQPLLRTASPPAGVAFPTIEKGFITPHFKLAIASDDEPISQREWWEQWPRRRNLDEFLSAHLAHPDSWHAPLIILGHPGAGKSLLTEVLAARLPAQGFTIVHVPLRHVHADDKILDQIETALRMKLKQSVSWGDLSEECGTTIRVVILDGLDELIQATGVTQSGYLTEVRRFQQEEYDLGRPVAFIVTSRTVVLDRARVPRGCLLVKLENFDEPQLMSWMHAWNRANSIIPAYTPLKAARLLSYGELALQPLLLTMIAIHAANSDFAERNSFSGSSSELYRQLLDDSIRRQVVDKPLVPPAEEDLPDLLANRRWFLSIAAFAMFNRGRQDVSEDELNRDCDALSGRTEIQQARGPGSPVSRAHRIISDFFFVHVAGAGLVPETSETIAGAARRNYEFLHSTFGEFLIAERTLKILSILAQGRAIVASEPSMRGVLNSGKSQVRLFLSHRPFLNREEIIDFMTQIFWEMRDSDREAILDILTELIMTARTSFADDFNGYEPSPCDVVSRLASYMVNLISVRLSLEGGPVALKSIAPTGCDPLTWWQSTVRLLHAGLEPEGWAGMLSVVRAINPPDEAQGKQISMVKGGTEALMSEVLTERELLFCSPVIDDA